jgi:hypothetical protein
MLLDRIGYSAPAFDYFFVKRAPWFPTKVAPFASSAPRIRERVEGFGPSPSRSPKDRISHVGLAAKSNAQMMHGPKSLAVAALIMLPLAGSGGADDVLPPTVVSVDDLLANPAAYDGRLVSTTGQFHVDPSPATEDFGFFGKLGSPTQPIEVFLGNLSPSARSNLPKECVLSEQDVDGCKLAVVGVAFIHSGQLGDILVISALSQPVPVEPAGPIAQGANHGLVLLAPPNPRARIEDQPLAQRALVFASPFGRMVHDRRSARFARDHWRARHRPLAP